MAEEGTLAVADADFLADGGDVFAGLPATSLNVHDGSEAVLPLYVMCVVVPNEALFMHGSACRLENEPVAPRSLKNVVVGGRQLLRGGRC